MSCWQMLGLRGGGRKMSSSAAADDEDEEEAVEEAADEAAGLAVGHPVPRLAPPQQATAAAIGPAVIRGRSWNFVEASLQQLALAIQPHSEPQGQGRREPAHGHHLRAPQQTAAQLAGPLRLVWRRISQEDPVAAALLQLLEVPAGPEDTQQGLLPRRRLTVTTTHLLHAASCSDEEPAKEEVDEGTAEGEDALAMSAATALLEGSLPTPEATWGSWAMMEPLQANEELGGGQQLSSPGSVVHGRRGAGACLPLTRGEVGQEWCLRGSPVKAVALSRLAGAGTVQHGE
eukprot:CAMPEP_0170076884 /NCGR_PEP_ID=MMETSP0019_2-20121128/13813_1 /TAXON_ID=98059 /ORGANISM="Dinobryon sp., Strain UTEXLB2267" /LENGTH=287 /DNA_ID=CAMNT_0010288883 /DNA_START=151 /DNA_END=1013 /DNA_ORIENTATION=+